MGLLETAGAVLGASGGFLSGIGKGPKRQYKYARKMFDYQAAYNHPKAQMARLKEAGLNPHLVYGEGTAGATGQTTGMDSIDFNQGVDAGNLPEAVGNYFSIKNAALKNDQQQIQNSLLGIERSLAGDKAYIERGIMHQQYDFASSRKGHGPLRIAQGSEEEFKHQAEARSMQMSLIKQRYANNQIDLYIKNESKRDQVKKIANEALATGFGASLREQEKILKQAEVNLFNTLPRNTVQPIIAILRMLLLRK